MYKSDSHIVNSEIFEFETDDKNKAFEIQKTLRSILKNNLSGTMDKICSKYSPEELVVIDKIEIDLGNLDLENLEIDLNKKFEEEFEIKIVNELKDVSVSQTTFTRAEEESNFELIKYFLINGYLPWWVDNKERINIDEIFRELLSSMPQNILSIFNIPEKQEIVVKRFISQFESSTVEKFYKHIEDLQSEKIRNYLKEFEITFNILKNKLPSTFGIESTKLAASLSFLFDQLKVEQATKTLVETIVQQTGLEINDFFLIFNKAVNKEIEFIKESKEAVRFISQLFSEVFEVTAIKEELAEEIAKTLKKIEMSESLITGLQEEDDLAKGVTDKEILQSNKELEPGKKESEISKTETVKTKEQEKQEKLQIKGKLEPKSEVSENLSGKVDKEKNINQFEVEKPAKQKSETTMGEKESTSKSKKEIDPEETYKIEDILKAKTDKLLSEDSQVTESQDTVELKEPMFVNNAGLVLLSPFFPRFFERVSLVDENGFKDNSLQERAIKLIQYLVTGENVIREFDIALNKVLCGMDINQTIDKEFDITDEEKENCESLLRSVVEYWSALKNTSVEGLRNSFLLRRGKLDEIEDQWRLNVEEKAFDVLLDTLPWSISIIKFKWMNKPVYVEWR